MANIKSAAKRAQVAERNRFRNKAVKSTIKTVVRKLKDQLAKDKEDKATVQTLLNECYKKLDGAVSKGVYHKNTVARYKGRLTKMVNKELAAE